MPPSEADEMESPTPVSPVVLESGATSGAMAGAAAAASFLSSSMSSVVSSLETFGAAIFFVPQLLQNASPGTVGVPHCLHSAIYFTTDRFPLCHLRVLRVSVA